MQNSIFGELTFDIGWKCKINISLFGHGYNITVKAKAYYEKDGITQEQEKSFKDFMANQKDRLKTVEELLSEFASTDASFRFIPKTLHFKRNGGYALLLDDRNDKDDGVAVCLAPLTKLMSQDEYL